MPDFAYTAVDSSGQRVRGTLSARDEDALATLLRQQDRYLVQVKLADETIDLAEVRFFERVNRRDLIFFTSQLATMIATGVPLAEGLAGIGSEITKVPLKRCVARLQRDVESGYALSESLDRQRSVFGELYVNIVRAGEATGRLEQVLEDLVRQLEWQDRLASRIKEALTYPMIVVGLLTVLMTVLVGFSIPRISSVYQRLASTAPLPMPTRVVMGFAQCVTTNWLTILAAIAAIVLALRLRAQTPEGAVTFARLMLRVPLLGELLRKIALSRFAHYFGTLHQAGLEVAPSLTLMERLIGNPFLAQRFRRAVDRVLAGEPLSRALTAVGQFSPIVIQMIAVGERTGQMSKSLENVRQYYDREVDQTVDRALTLFGPIMLLVLASVFVLMAVAYYLPLFGLMKVIKVT
jgi:type II secretory pathway component PulF